MQEAWHSFIDANVDLGHTKVMQIRQREPLSHQGAITHEVCCCTAQFQNVLRSILSFKEHKVARLSSTSFQ